MFSRCIPYFISKASMSIIVLHLSGLTSKPLSVKWFQQYSRLNVERAFLKVQPHVVFLDLSKHNLQIENMSFFFVKLYYYSILVFEDCISNLLKCLPSIFELEGHLPCNKFFIIRYECHLFTFF